MPQMNGGQALMGSLQRMGVDMVFGVPGYGQYEAVDALYGHSQIRYLSTRHEQEATFMADAYASIAGQPAVALVLPGPGLLYAGAGVATGFANSSPILLITSANPDPIMGSRQLELRTLEAMTKWSCQVEDIAEIPGAIYEAFRQMGTGRPRPTGLVIPSHILATDGAVLLPDGPPATERTVARGTEQAVAWLTQARKPLLWVGGGVIHSGAGHLIREFAETYRMPVATTRKGKGIVAESHPLGMGSPEMRYAPLRNWIQGRDLILAIGTKQDFSGFPMRVIQIDRDETRTSASADMLVLQGDALATLGAICKRLHDAASRPVPLSDEDMAEIRMLRTQRWDPQKQLQPQWDFMQAIRTAAPADTIFVQGMNQMGYYSRNYLSMTETGRLLSSSSQATLGAAYPMSLGAKLAAPQRPVISISGDGGFLYCAQAMATAVQNSIHSIVLVFNDNAYGNVLRAQKEEFDHRVIGTQLHNPDFVQLARSYGARAARAHTAEELAQALQTALQADAHSLIEIPVGEMERQF